MGGETSRIVRFSVETAPEISLQAAQRNLARCVVNPLYLGARLSEAVLRVRVCSKRFGDREYLMTDDSTMDPSRTNSGVNSTPSFAEDAFEQLSRIWQIFAECRLEGQPYPDLATLDRLTNDQ